MTAEMFKDKVLRHSADMWRIAVSILRDGDTAKDAVQDALTRLWENRERLGMMENAGPYCLTVVRNVAIDVLRRNSVLSMEPIDEAYSLMAPDRTPEQLLQGSQKVDLIERLISTLSPAQQTVIRMSSFGGCDIAEIQTVTGLSADNVRALLSRGRRKLRDLYQQVTAKDNY